MKPPPFEYDAPATLSEALDLLAEHGDSAKVLAGGQSLVPLMNFRLARPDRLVDLNGVEELAHLGEDGGELVIGAMTRTAALERSAVVAGRFGLIREAVRFVGHFQIRNRGTVGGSVAHADPAAELPAVFVALGARIVAASKAGTRTLDADGFFHGYFTTSLRPDEVLTEIRVPAPAGTGYAFEELARRPGDFALGGIACALGNGSPRVVALGLAARPVRLERAEARLAEGGGPDDVRRAVKEEVDGIDATSDLHAGAAYRKLLAAELAGRAVERALERAAA
jgi:CO/xanthine dehydrogenase FAD-binding subunit